MRRLMAAATATGALLLGMPAPAQAERPPGWTSADRTLTWTSPRVVAPGDAAVEFWSGDRLLGRAEEAPDLRTFVLRGSAPRATGDLQVRRGGRRIDAATSRVLPQPADRAPAEPPTLPPNAVDPGVEGPYETMTGEYSLPGVALPGYPAPVEIQAIVVGPRGAPGRRPLAMFLHGRRWTCFVGDDRDALRLRWPCPAGSEPVPSYRGYLQAQRLLASQGHVTVSISANGVNGQDRADADGGAQARSSLIRTHLARWADWAGAGRAGAPAIVRAVPQADLSKVFLVGHSRGGEGAARAALDSLEPPAAAQDGPVRWTIRGMLLIGPTAFGQNPQPDVPSVTILPGCDGDVFNLQGQMYVDAARGAGSGHALHSALYMVGANHGYFNTESTPGQAVAPAWDDFVSDEPDAVCTPEFAPTRLTPGQQQTAGATYIAAAARLFVTGDDRVRPLLDGSGVRAPSAGPARVVAHAIGGNRTPVIIPGPALTVHGGRLCDQIAAEPENACLHPGSPYEDSPHFMPFRTPEPGRHAVALDGPATATLRPARAMPVAGYRALTMRLMVPPNAPATSFDVTVTDDRGRRTELGTATITGLPGSASTVSRWAQEVRLPLPAKVRTVARLDLTPHGDRPAWLIDAWGWNPGSPAPHPAALDRVDLGDLTVKVNDSGVYGLPVRVRGPRPAEVRLFLRDLSTGLTTSWTTAVGPATTRIDVPVPTAATEGGDRSFDVAAKAVRNAVVGDYQGSLQLLDPPSAGNAP
ncbi:hypothetical protein AB0A95_18610 [Micromonospora sp. NPDC049230]|uniref:hypothetical protein n=1 Tax=Micromonospora sp. NPDC049230 TaxID=3155502 RepID=UPI00340EECA1